MDNEDERLRKLADKLRADEEREEQDSNTVAEAMPKLGQRFGDYMVENRKPDVGTFGFVYRVQDIHRGDGQPYALKLFNPFLLDDFVAYDQFMAESDILRAVQHPNLVRWYSTGMNNGLVFITMEWLEGDTLAEAILKDRLDVRGCIEIVCDLCAPVATLHARGVIHRDLKPSNVMLVTRPNGSRRVVLYDLGAAHAPTEIIGQRGADSCVRILGTFGFMSPQQANGMPAQVTDDVWSLGAILFCALHKRTMQNLHNTTQEEQLEQAKRGEVSFPSWTRRTPKAIKEVLTRALDPDPTKRYQTVEELQQALEEVLTRLPIAALRPVRAPSHPLQRFLRAAAVIAALGALFISDTNLPF